MGPVDVATNKSLDSEGNMLIINIVVCGICEVEGVWNPKSSSEVHILASLKC